MLDVNLALMSRLGRVAVPNPGQQTATEDLLTWISELAHLGYAASDELLAAAAKNSAAADEILEALKIHARDHVGYKPLHGDFENFMSTATDREVYVSAVLHYVSVYHNLASFDSQTEATVGAIRSSTRGLTVLEGASPDDAAGLARELVTQGQPFSETDLEHVILFLDFVAPNMVDVQIHENLAHLASLDSAWTSKMTTLTDVLRYATALSGGHPSLAEKHNFKLRRPQRREVAHLLDRILRDNGENFEDFTRFPEAWKRLAASAHLGDYGLDGVNRALEAVYRESARSFESRVDAAMLQSTVAAADLLEDRPGVFARRLMELVRASGPIDRRLVLADFSHVAHKVSLRVLIQLYDYLRGPSSEKLEATPLFAKSKTGGSIPNKRIESDEYADVLAAVRHGFRDRLSDRSFNVDQSLAGQYAIPMGVRTASNSSRVIGRGSRIKLDSDAEFVRLFAHWKNTPDRVDIDLSGVFVSEDLQSSKSIWYGNLRSSGGEFYHSGDIVDAPNGAAEFIDVPLRIVDGMRYVALSVHSYTGQPLSSIPEAWSGVMQRKGINSGENFEAADVAIRGDLMSDARQALTLVVDLQEREVIWVDRSASGLPAGGNVKNSRPTLILNDAILQPRMTVAELLDLTGAAVSRDGDDLDPARAEQVLGLLV